MVQLFCLDALVSSFFWIPQQPDHSLILDIYSSILKDDLVERQLVWEAEELSSSLDSAKSRNLGFLI